MSLLSSKTLPRIDFARVCSPVVKRHQVLVLIACLVFALLGMVLHLPSTLVVPGLVSPLSAEPRAAEISPSALVDPAKVAPFSRRSSVSVTPPMDSAAARVAVTANSYSGGTVYGRVLDQDDIGVPQAGVRLYRRGLFLDQVTDGEGRFSFAGLAAGSYRLLVNIRSMPDGYLPPWRQEVLHKYSGHATGLFATSFELKQNRSREVDLRVFAASSLSGRLVGPFGDPIAAASVHIRSAQGITGSTRTDATGRFVLAGVYPGKYVASTILNPVSATHTPLPSSSSPLPVPFELAGGEALVLDDFIAGSGGHVLRGSVVDQNGSPVAGLVVRCVVAGGAQPSPSWETVTGRAGRYELGRVPSAVLSLTVGHEKSTNPRRTPRLAKRVAPIRIDALRAKRVIEITVVEVEATHPFHILGKVRVDPDWAEANQLQSVRARFEVDGVDARRLPSAYGSRFGGHDLNWNFEFEWDCATPRAELQLRVVLLDAEGREHVKCVSARPVADATEEVLFAFP
jgi:hypothetical protein